MKKDTMYLLGGVALIGLAYYLYNKNQTSTSNNTAGFANLSGGDCTCSPNPCPTGYSCQKYKTRSGVYKCACIMELK